MPLQLTAQHNQEIRAHGAEDYPNECCGFLVGRTDGEDVLVLRTVRAVNLREDSPRNRFEIDPGDMVKTDKAARRDGLGVVGFYHSHPDAPARPSEFDREHAWPGYCYVIVSVQNGLPKEMQNWRLAEDGKAFTEDEIVITEF